MGDHEAALLKVDNPMLWWMVQHSAALTEHPVLQSIFAQYRQSRLEVGRNICLPLYFPKRWVPFRYEEIVHYSDYNHHFVYGITCDEDLAERPVIRAQLDAGYCGWYPPRPACTTHQLMGFRLMQQNGCGEPLATQEAVTALQHRIRRQLVWDPRVVDVYMQRVLMLVESGAASDVKPIWLHRLLDAQHTDGGWGGIDTLLALPAGNSFGFDARGFTFSPDRSNFHTTAQGVWLMSLLLSAERNAHTSN